VTVFGKKHNVSYTPTLSFNNERNFYELGGMTAKWNFENSFSLTSYLDIALNFEIHHQYVSDTDISFKDVWLKFGFPNIYYFEKQDISTSGHFKFFLPLNYNTSYLH